MLRGAFGGLCLIIFFVTSSAHAEFAGAECLTPAEIEAEVDHFRWYITPLLATLDRPLEIFYQDFNFKVSGAATMQKDKLQIHVTGHQCADLLHRDELRLLLCHELGHVAGGAPYMTFMNNPHAQTVSSEGQADFFATSACLPYLLQGEDQTPYLSLENEYPALTQICPQKEDQERGLCMRMAKASFNFATFVHPGKTIGSYPPRDPGPLPDLNTQSTTVVSKTLIREYPTPQCRLDTYIAGIHCRAKKAFSNYTSSPESAVACAESAQSAPRPSCWFKAE